MLVKAKVPFPFVVNGRAFPAGTYIVQRDATTGREGWDVVTR